MQHMQHLEDAKKLLAFIDRSDSCFHVVKNIEQELKQHGFCKLREQDPWNLEYGKSYYVTRNASSILSFKIPDQGFQAIHFMASHSDSPTFKIKPNPDIPGGACIRLNIEKYGGMILSTWMDRPLSVAGRILVQKENGHLEQVLVAPDKDLMIIPSLAIHMDRNANTNQTLNVQNDMLPIYAMDDSEEEFPDVIAREAGVLREEILGMDLFLVNRQAGAIVGAHEEFISSAKLDDLECAYLTLQGFLEADGPQMQMHCIFDNEEVGSTTRQGAASTFLQDTLERIMEALGISMSEYRRILANSMMFSADNAHALHPNFTSKADPTNRPLINGGIVLKYHANQKYTTDAVSESYFKVVCKQADVPYQTFTNRSDMAGGSTLGNISNTQVSVRCADIGLAQWAMHSAYETAGSKDVSYLKAFAQAFYSMELPDIR